MRNKKNSRYGNQGPAGHAIGFLVPSSGQVLVFLQLIMGRGAPCTKVCVKLDEFPSRDVPVNSMGYWQFINSYPLEEGKHRLSLYSPCQNRSVSICFEINLLGCLPLPTVAHPAEGMTVFSDNPLIAGSAKPCNTVSVSNATYGTVKTKVASDGRYRAKFPCHFPAGYHNIAVAQKDSAGGVSGVTKRNFYVCKLNS